MRDAKGIWICFDLFLSTHHQASFDVPGDSPLTPQAFYIPSGGVRKDNFHVATLVNFTLCKYTLTVVHDEWCVLR